MDETPAINVEPRSQKWEEPWIPVSYLNASKFSYVRKNKQYIVKPTSIWGFLSHEIKHNPKSMLILPISVHHVKHILDRGDSVTQICVSIII